MSKPRRPRNARPAQKAFTAQPGVIESPSPASEAEGTAADAAGTETTPADMTAADPAFEHVAEALDATFEAPAALATAAADEILSVEAREAEASDALPPSRPAVVLPPYNATSLGTTVMNYVIGEGEAFAAHMRALAGARSVADFVRLQIGEFQRAADATLTCWGILALSASRTASLR